MNWYQSPALNASESGINEQERGVLYQVASGLTTTVPASSKNCCVHKQNVTLLFTCIARLEFVGWLDDELFMKDLLQKVGKRCILSIGYLLGGHFPFGRVFCRCRIMANIRFLTINPPSINEGVSNLNSHYPNAETKHEIHSQTNAYQSENHKEEKRSFSVRNKNSHSQMSRSDERSRIGRTHIATREKA